MPLWPLRGGMLCHQDQPVDQPVDPGKPFMLTVL